jgi:hypothetical protein
LPVFDETSKADPTACSNSCRSSTAVLPKTWLDGVTSDEGWCTPLHAAGKGAATNAAAAIALFVKNFRLETDIGTSTLLFKATPSCFETSQENSSFQIFFSLSWDVPGLSGEGAEYSTCFRWEFPGQILMFFNYFVSHIALYRVEKAFLNGDLSAMSRNELRHRMLSDHS